MDSCQCLRYVVVAAFVNITPLSDDQCIISNWFLFYKKVWIIEHCPTIVHRYPRDDYEEPAPRMLKWEAIQGVDNADKDLVLTRQRLDGMRSHNVS